MERSHSSFEGWLKGAWPVEALKRQARPRRRPAGRDWILCILFFRVSTVAFVRLVVLADAENQFVTPELYVTPWFLTLFSSKTSLLVLFALWDKYLVENDQYFFPFIGLALLICFRKDIMKTEVSQLPETLSKITIHSIDQLRQVTRSERINNARASVVAACRTRKSRESCIAECPLGRTMLGRVEIRCPRGRGLGCKLIRPGLVVVLCMPSGAFHPATCMGGQSGTPCCYRQERGNPLLTVGTFSSGACRSVTCRAG